MGPRVRIHFPPAGSPLRTAPTTLGAPARDEHETKSLNRLRAPSTDDGADHCVGACCVCQSSAEDGTAPQSFFVLDNPGDLNFNQLLGINDRQVIVGYFGDGTVVPNNGYVLVPKNHYSEENFTNLPTGDFASQTQAIGINTRRFPDIVGFYTDNATGFTHGFLDSNGVQSPIDDPAGSPPNVTTPVQNLLGINNFEKAAGFWTDNNAHEHGFVVKLDTHSPSSSTFIEIPPTTFAGAVATQASDITNNDQVCGFWTDANGNNHGFFGRT